MAILILTHEGLTLQKFTLEKAEIRIGRRTDADIYIDDMLASQRHAKIETAQATTPDGGVEYYIEDLGSTNSTFVNNEMISRKKLAHEDLIRVGSHVFKFINEDETVGDKTTKLHKSWIPGFYYTKD